MNERIPYTLTIILVEYAVYYRVAAAGDEDQDLHDDVDINESADDEGIRQLVADDPDGDHLVDVIRQMTNSEHDNDNENDPRHAAVCLIRLT
jgi:hypothetical protein